MIRVVAHISQRRVVLSPLRSPGLLNNGARTFVDEVSPIPTFARIACGSTNSRKLAYVLVCVATWTITTSCALAASPPQFRAHLNALCRGYSPDFKSEETRITDAARAKHVQIYYSDVGRFFSLLLGEDRDIENATVPVALRGLMARVSHLLRTADVSLREGIAATAGHEGAGIDSTLAKISSLGKPVNAALDAAGLRDCGSNQQ